VPVTVGSRLHLGGGALNATGSERAADRYIAGWVVAAVVGAFALVAWQGFPPIEWATILTLIAIVAIAERVELVLPFERSAVTFTLIEAAIVVALLLLEPTHVVLVSTTGMVIAQGRRLLSVRKLLFNVAQLAVGSAAAASLVAAVPPVGPTIGGRSALTALAAMMVYTAVNSVAMMGLLDRLAGADAFAAIRRQIPMTFVAALGTASVGIIGAELWFSNPGLVVLLLAPGAAIHLAARAQIRAAALLDQVRSDHDRLTRIVDGAHDGILLLDRSGVVQVWNPAMETMTGLPADRVVGHPIERVLTDTVREADEPVRGRWLVEQAHAGSSRRELDARLRSVDGVVREVRESHSLVFDERGRCTGDVVVVRDVSRQRELERLRGDFVARVSHELRTPLTPIRGFANILLKRGDHLDATQRDDALERIVERADHLSDLVEDLLLVTRLDRRELDDLVHARPTALVAVLETAADNARGRDPARTISIHAAPGTGDALADPDRVRQIAEALLDNACQYSPDDTPIEVELDQDGDDVRVRVIDHGPGIPRDQREAIFEQFHRLEDPLTMRTGGVGLGLFIGRRLAQAMHGTLEVEDAGSGHGAVLTLRLPAAEPVTSKETSHLGA
jgi:PAS domain S-box-containing protein